MSVCPLCALTQKVNTNHMEEILLHDDKICFVVYCNNQEHKTTPMVILKRHCINPMVLEIRHIFEVMNLLYPLRHARNRGMFTIKEHWHEHWVLGV